MKNEFIILAAGKGKRMATDVPKVLLPLGGEPMLFHIIKQVATIKHSNINLVIGNGSPQVKDALNESLHIPVRKITQQHQLGTGHAVAQAIRAVSNDCIVVVLYGDVPLLQKSTIVRMINAAQGLSSDSSSSKRGKQRATKANSGNCAVWLTALMENPTGYGRIIRNPVGNPIAIMEEKDCNSTQRKIKEVNTGIMAAPAASMKKWLRKLMAQKPANKQQEYLLTDLMLMAHNEEHPIKTLTTKDTSEFLGANDMLQLAHLERVLQLRRVGELAKRGVYFRDPKRADICGDIKVGRNVRIGVNVILSGDIKIGNDVTIGNHCNITSSIIKDGSEVKDFCHIQDSRIGKQCTLGPYARLRPQSILEDEAMLGNFIEVKNSKMGKGSKANHLSYIGDSQIGKGVNMGAGTITCNYDGKNKHQTTIKDGAFIGSNTALVAPVTVGKNAIVGAGSVITENIPAASLAITRSPQKNIKGYQRNRK